MKLHLRGAALGGWERILKRWLTKAYWVFIQKWVILRRWMKALRI